MVNQALLLLQARADVEVSVYWGLCIYLQAGGD